MVTYGQRREEECGCVGRWVSVCEMKDEKGMRNKGEEGQGIRVVERMEGGHDSE